MARPQKTIKRTEIVKVRFTIMEKTLIIAHAKRSNITPSEFIRSKSLNHTVAPRLNEEEVLWLRKLIGMANNLNTIALKANLGDVVRPLMDEVNSTIEKLR